MSDSMPFFRLDIFSFLHDDIAVHHNQAPIGVIDESLVLGFLNEARNRFSCEANV